MLNDATTPLSLLLSRRSVKAQDLAAPGPDGVQLARILAAAIRVPDHGKLAPWRFLEITDRTALQSLIDREVDAHRPDLPESKRAKVARYAHQAPTLIAVVVPEPDTSNIPEWEQHLSAGAACQNLLLAAHAQGYAGCWLTGVPAYLPGVEAALGGRIAGFIFLGTPARQPDERPRPALSAVTARWP
jgi:nitroreductase